MRAADGDPGKSGEGKRAEVVIVVSCWPSISSPLVPKLRLGTRWWRSSASPRVPSAPVGHYRNESRHARVIPSARISPVGRIVHVAALHRVPVDVLKLLLHHLVAPDHLRMAAFLPKLVVAFALVFRFQVAEEAEDSLSIAGSRWSIIRRAVYVLNRLICSLRSSADAMRCRWFSRMT